MQQAITANPAPAPNGVRERLRRPAPLPQAVSAHVRNDDDLIIEYQWAGDRYWFRLDDAQATEPRWLFKIPGLTGARPERSRDCNPRARAHAPVIAQVVAILRRDHLVEAAFAAARDRQAREAADERDLRIDYAKSESGPDLYAALKRVVEQSPVPYPWITEAKAALARADERIAAELAQLEAA